MSDNPLNSRFRPDTTQDPGLKQHAAVFHHVNSMAPSDLPAKADKIDYLLPLLGQLAGNPKVTAKDVIKAAAGGAADGEVDPAEAVQFISSMPSDPDKLQGWLRNIYAANLAASVHMKAAMMRAAQPAQPPVATPPGSVPGAPQQ